MAADLHLHTTASDGTFSPESVVEMAHGQSLQAISITDHDTLEGLPEALQRARDLKLFVIPGIELSTLLEEREIHILGYFIKYNHPELQRTLHQFIETRERRAERMVHLLKNQGYNITLERVKEIAKSPVIGRPHIARALLERGYIQEMDEAFSSHYIGRGGRAYVERFKITPKEAIHLIKSYGGYSVLAHPGLTGTHGMKKKEIITLKEEGLDGIEVFYSGHRRQQRDYYHQLALEHKLLITGGSDFHGFSTHAPSLGPYLPKKYLDIFLERAETEGKTL